MSTMFRDFGAAGGETNLGSQISSSTEFGGTSQAASGRDVTDGSSAEVSQVAPEEIEELALAGLKSQGAIQSWRNEPFKLKSRIQKLVNDFEFGADLRPVSYKTDGSRFDLDTTIKLNVNAAYQISFNFRPVVRIERLEIMGDVKVPTETARDIESITYMTYFDTKAKETSKKRERSKIHIAMDLGEHGHLNFDIQAKFYAEKNDNHVSWGNPLHQIELEASCLDGEVKVSKTTFR